MDLSPWFMGVMIWEKFMQPYTYGMWVLLSVHSTLIRRFIDTRQSQAQAQAHGKG